MPQPAETPLLRALNRLAGVLGTRDAARRWYETYLAVLGSRAVVDTANGGTLTWIHRRAAGSDDVLPLPTVRWVRVQSGGRLLQGIEIHDGHQQVTLLYDESGRLADRSPGDRHPGRLVELARVVAKAKDPMAESVAFVAGLGDERQGPGRIHYPVPVPGGVVAAWRAGLMGCRRALFDGRVDGAARFIVADGLEGRAVGLGATLQGAMAAYDAEVARALPEQRRTSQSITDDYDDDGNLIARGELPPELEESATPSDVSAVYEEVEDEREPWQAADPESSPSFAPEVDPVTGRIDLTGGSIVFRGSTSDAPPVPARPDCVPHVVLPLEPSPETPPALGRWVRLLGELGATRHAVRIEERDGFVLVGADLLGVLDLKSLRTHLDHLDVEAGPVAQCSTPEDERFMRYRARLYRWIPASASRPEGLAAMGGSAAPRFEPGDLDGDILQAAVRRHRRIPRPKD